MQKHPTSLIIKVVTQTLAKLSNNEKINMPEGEFKQEDVLVDKWNAVIQGDVELLNESEICEEEIEWLIQ